MLTRAGCSGDEWARAVSGAEWARAVSGVEWASGADTGDEWVRAGPGVVHRKQAAKADLVVAGCHGQLRALHGEGKTVPRLSLGGRGGQTAVLPRTRKLPEL